MLACYHYPFVENQNYIEYTVDDFRNLSKVRELFDYCQILEAYITSSGWDFLIGYHGYEVLYQIDQESGWCDADTLEEFKIWLEAERECSKPLD